MSDIGVLYLVSTPIGNLRDVTLRALDVLRSVDRVACEDTRRSRKLLAAYEIRKPLLAVPAADEKRRARKLSGHLEIGENIAFVSDAGTPAISDPGRIVVLEALRVGARVVPVPGPSALTAAAAASGLVSGRFCFLGFLPRKTTERRELIEKFGALPAALVIHEAPTRLDKTLSDLSHSLDDDRRAVVCRELTKIHEEIEHGSLADLALRYTDGARGEVTIVIGPPAKEKEKDALLTMEEAVPLVRERVRGGERLKDACKAVARDSKVDARTLYRACT